MRWVITCMLSCLLAFTIGCGERPANDYSAWDSDGDGTVARSEFHEGYFRRWDTDGSDYIDPSEYEVGITDGYFFQAFDENENAQISRAEWDQGAAGMNLFDEDMYDDEKFSSWDQDGDGSLSYNEFARGSFADWDANANDRIDEDEFVESSFVGVYDDWNANDDDYLSDKELSNGMDTANR